jgi:glycosyltransferase involved in cell wall biosynthesis
MDVIVAPVTMGTGINVKTVQAMAFGMPLISTAWGVKGIETDDPAHHHKDLDELARALLELCTRPEQLDRLAGVSLLRYQQYLDTGTAAFAALCRHAKLGAAGTQGAEAAVRVEPALTA